MVNPLVNFDITMGKSIIFSWENYRAMGNLSFLYGKTSRNKWSCFNNHVQLPEGRWIPIRLSVLCMWLKKEHQCAEWLYIWSLLMFWDLWPWCFGQSHEEFLHRSSLAEKFPHGLESQSPRVPYMGAVGTSRFHNQPSSINCILHHHTISPYLLQFHLDMKPL